MNQQPCPIEASVIAPNLWMGSRPPLGAVLRRCGVDIVVLCAYEHQPNLEMFSGVEVARMPLDDSLSIPPADAFAAFQLAIQLAKQLKRGKRILITYSRPFARGRTIWGTVVPVDSLWRTGANLATALTTEADLHVGGTTVPHGSYTLYSILKEKTLLLIVSKKPGGTEPRYDPKEDLVRIDMKGEPATPPIDPFRIWFEPSRGDSVTLHLGWSDRQFSIGVTSK